MVGLLGAKICVKLAELSSIFARKEKNVFMLITGVVIREDY